MHPVRALRSAFGAAFAAFLLSASPSNLALAATACMPTAMVRDLLAEEYGERPVVIGVTSAGRVMVLYENPKTRAWSIVVFTPRGLGCLIQSGGGLRFMRAPKLKSKGKAS